MPADPVDDALDRRIAAWKASQDTQTPPPLVPAAGPGQEAYRAARLELTAKRRSELIRCARTPRPVASSSHGSAV